MGEVKIPKEMLEAATEGLDIRDPEDLQSYMIREQAIKKALQWMRQQKAKESWAR